MDTGAALGGTGLFISVFGIIYSAINHKHIKTRCCGKVYEASIDIGPNEPEAKGEAKGEAKPEAKPEAKGEAKSEARPEAKPENKLFKYTGTLHKNVPHFDI